MKVLIGGDFEGIATVCSWAEIEPGHPDYERNRIQYTNEMNAAIAGAFDAGATEVYVRDGHGGNKSLIPELLDERAIHIKGRCSEDYRAMILTIEEGYDAVLFVGYHAKAGTPDGVMAHSMERFVLDFSINGISMPEAGYNALVAGMYNVPVVYVAGDEAICRQSKKLFGDIETTAVKIGLSQNSAKCLAPKVACEEIRKDVFRALKQGKRCVYKLQGPYEVSFQLERTYDAPPKDMRLKTDSLEECLHLFWEMT